MASTPERRIRGMEFVLMAELASRWNLKYIAIGLLELAQTAFDQEAVPCSSGTYKQETQSLDP
jgi:hypothetical protein